MAEPIGPVNVQDTLDAWLAAHPEAQKYVAKLWYVPAGRQPPPEVTHTIGLRSQSAAERSLTIGLVVLPEFAAVLDALLALLATQPVKPPA